MHRMRQKERTKRNNRAHPERTRVLRRLGATALMFLTGLYLPGPGALADPPPELVKPGVVEGVSTPEVVPPEARDKPERALKQDHFQRPVETTVTAPIVIVDDKGNVCFEGEITIWVDRSAGTFDFVLELSDGQVSRTLSQTLCLDGDAVYTWGTLAVTDKAGTQTYKGGWTYTEANEMSEDPYSDAGFHAQVAELSSVPGRAGQFHDFCCATEYAFCQANPCCSAGFCQDCYDECVEDAIPNPCHACGYCGASWFLCYFFGGHCGDWRVDIGIAFWVYCLSLPSAE